MSKGVDISSECIVSSGRAVNSACVVGRRVISVEVIVSGECFHHSVKKNGVVDERK